jgi:hypothetical protein
MLFFFDYTSSERSLYDYRGAEFSSAKGAIEMAGFLSHSLQAEWAGWCVEVRNPDGTIIFQKPVDTPSLIAA